MQPVTSAQQANIRLYADWK